MTYTSHMQWFMGCQLAHASPRSTFPHSLGIFLLLSSHALLSLTKATESKENLLERNNNEPLELVNTDSWPHPGNSLNHTEKNSS